MMYVIFTGPMSSNAMYNIAEKLKSQNDEKYLNCGWMFDSLDVSTAVLKLLLGLMTSKTINV